MFGIMYAELILFVNKVYVFIAFIHTNFLIGNNNKLIKG